MGMMTCFLAFGVGSIGGTELLIIGLIVVLVFGGARIPALVRGISRVPLEFLKGRRKTTEPGNDNKLV